MKIEAQGRFLERIMEEHRIKATCSNKPSKSSYSPMSLPSLCDDSESNIKDIESDSEVVDRNEMTTSNQVFPPTKRVRFDDNEAMSHQRYSVVAASHSSSGSLNNNNNTNNNNNNLPFSAMDMNNIPWSFMSFQSPILPALYDSLI